MKHHNENQERDAETGRMCSLYKTDYDERLIEHLNRGLSYESFAGVVGVNRDTLYEWEKRYPTWKEAKALGKMKSLLFWERMGIAGTAGHIKGFNLGGWVINMRNRHNWKTRDTTIEAPKDDEITHDKIMKYIEGKEF